MINNTIIFRFLAGFPLRKELETFQNLKIRKFPTFVNHLFRYYVFFYHKVFLQMVMRRFAHCSEQVKIFLLMQPLGQVYAWGLQCPMATILQLFSDVVGAAGFCSASGVFAQARFYAIMRKKTASLLCRLRPSSNPLLKTISRRFHSSFMR